MIRKRVAAALLAGCLWSGQGCSDVTGGGGSEVPNELVGREIIPGKGPAAEAEVRFIPVEYVPGGTGSDNARLPSYTVKTDASGRFKLKGVVPGQYNVLAAKDGLKSLRDSVAVGDAGLDLGADSLKTPGSLYGTVGLQPGHDPRSATVQVLGTNVYLNVDNVGGFSLTDLAPGQYRLRIEVHRDGYTPLYAPVEVRAGKTDTLPTLFPFYGLIPAVTGLGALTNRDATVIVYWDSSSYPNVDAYLIYRDTSGSLLPSADPIKNVAKGFRFNDTLYSAHPREGQFPLDDSVIREITYRVRILDRNGDVGPAFAKATIIAYPPVKWGGLPGGRWRLQTEKAPFGARGNPAVVEFNQRFWLFGGMVEGGFYGQDAWSSEDCETWTREAVTLPFNYIGPYKVAVHQAKLWILGMEDPVKSRPVLYSSPDGREWTAAQAPPIATPRSGVAFAAFADKLWIFDGSPDGGVFTSPDGTDWTRVDMPKGFSIGRDPAVAIGYTTMSVMGGIDSADIDAARGIWSTPDGENWTVSADTSNLLPRAGFRLVDAAGWYAIGGIQPQRAADSSLVMLNKNDQVWGGINGDDWNLEDAHAPYGKRYSPGIAVFNRRIWIIGGMASPTGGPMSDIWYKDAY